MIVSMTEGRFLELAQRPFPKLHAAMYRELEWYATKDERLLGTVLLDRVDLDYSWVLLSRDAASVYRAIDLGTASPSPSEARQALADAMKKHLGERP